MNANTENLRVSTSAKLMRVGLAVSALAGIGLALYASIVPSPERGKNTLPAITAPLTAPLAESISQEKEQPDTKTDSQTEVKKKLSDLKSVLLVEDSTRYQSTLFETFQYINPSTKVTIFDNCPEALASITPGEPYDIAIFDHNLDSSTNQTQIDFYKMTNPDDGLECLERARTLMPKPNTIIIFFPGTSNPDLELKAKLAGADITIPKKNTVNIEDQIRSWFQ